MASTRRKKIQIQGIVQGVGFRPFVYREAVTENLKGFVSNTSHGVIVEVEGEPGAIERFEERLEKHPPVLSRITNIETTDIACKGEPEFRILSSIEDRDRTTLISPDISICEDCLRECFDPSDRRFRYPFINCTNCGPRYTIIEALPYDRPKTTMSAFTMCAECQREYDDPLNRRFHAQPNACHACGPRVWLVDPEGKPHGEKDPISAAVSHLRRGKIVAVKGIGGFHLACDATSEDGVSELRSRKGREEKPLAVMVPDLESASRLGHLSSKEQDILLSPRRPIVLVRKRLSSLLAESVAPRNAYVGIMLPYTPLHYLILREGFAALVMTSGNLSEEPIAVGNQEALERLGHVADFFLMHDREICQRSDDSVTRIGAGLPRPVRRSRGTVPFPVFLRKEVPSVLAVGGELKNTVCLTKGDRAFLSQHIGDLENAETLGFFEECVDHLKRILRIEPVAVAHDLHPDYLSTQWALDLEDLPSIAIQHHHAHIAACLAENGREDPVIGLSLDGTGYGSDGNVWGGEILIADLLHYERAGHFAYRPMPGGAVAIKEPWRMAVSYVYAMVNDQGETDSATEAFFELMGGLPLMNSLPHERISGVLRMMQRGIHVPLTSSLGRLFDGVASLIGLRHRVAFEGQAAMELEMAMKPAPIDAGTKEEYEFVIREEENALVIDPDSAIRMILQDIRSKRSESFISLRFHSSLLSLFVEICKRIRGRRGLEIVALSGGCFQNLYLIEGLSKRLGDEGFEVLTHTHVPSNDGGLSLGQAVIASYQLK